MQKTYAKTKKKRQKGENEKSKNKKGYSM